MLGVADAADAQQVAIDGAVGIAVVRQQVDRAEHEGVVFVARRLLALRNGCVVDRVDIDPGSGGAAQAIGVGNRVAEVGAAVEIGIGDKDDFALAIGVGVQADTAVRRLVHRRDAQHGHAGRGAAVRRAVVGQQVGRTDAQARVLGALDALARHARQGGERVGGERARRAWRGVVAGWQIARRQGRGRCGCGGGQRS
ncbi:MAG: hypothetical protein WKG52_08220 [Variovorax sp.]